MSKKDELDKAKIAWKKANKRRSKANKEWAKAYEEYQAVIIKSAKLNGEKYE